MPIEINSRLLKGTPDKLMPIVRGFIQDQAQDLTFTSQDTTFYLLVGWPSQGGLTQKLFHDLRVGAIQLLPLPNSKTEVSLVLYDIPEHLTDFLEERGVITKFCALWPALIRRLDGMSYLDICQETPKETIAPPTPTAAEPAETEEDGTGNDQITPYTWFPKKQDTVNKWKKSYEVILEKKEEYKQLYADLKTDDPNPSIDDLRDALANIPEWEKKPSGSTVRRIIKVGKEGYLK